MNSISSQLPRTVATTAATGRGGDILAMMFPIKRTDNPVKSPAKSHETKKANKASYKISKSCQEKNDFPRWFLFTLDNVIRVLI